MCNLLELFYWSRQTFLLFSGFKYSWISSSKSRHIISNKDLVVSLQFAIKNDVYLLSPQSIRMVTDTSLWNTLTLCIFWPWRYINSVRKMETCMGIIDYKSLFIRWPLVAHNFQVNYLINATIQKSYQFEGEMDERVAIRCDFKNTESSGDSKFT